MALTPGTKLGAYEILSVLGTGGMGEVYRARDSALGRDVAVKILRPGASNDADRLRRFRQEAQSAAALNHPNILAIHFVGEQDGSPYIVSELLEGESLRERLRSGALPVRKCMDYAAQIAEGLAAAHEKGVVHRDLKPENIFLTKDGRAKILDFGLAKLTRPEQTAAEGGSLTLTQGSAPGVVLGTVGYMSPEQVRGKTLDPRSDIFSFGLILYEMLSGKNVFLRGTTADTMSAILKEDPPELPLSTGGISPALDRVVRRCLEKEPADRFQSVRDLGFALQAITGNSASSSSATAAAIPDTRKKSLGAALLAAVALLALVASYFAGRHGSAGLATAQPEFHQLTFRRGTIRSARFAPDGQTFVYGASLDGGPARLYVTRTGGPESSPLGLTNANLLGISSSGEMGVTVGCQIFFVAHCRGTLARMPLSGGAPREITEDVAAADWLPDGKELAAVRKRGGHYLVEFPVGNVIYDTTGWVSSLRVSPSGDLLALADHPEVNDDYGAVVILDSKGNRIASTAPYTSLEGVAWSPKGDEVWFAASSGEEGWADQIRALDISGKQRMLLRLPGITRLHDVFRDGRVLMSKEDWRMILGFRGPKDTRDRDLSWLDAPVLSDLSPDGSSVTFVEIGAAGRNGYFIYLRKSDGSPALKLGEGRDAALSPDGKSVLALGPIDSADLDILPVGVGEARHLQNPGLIHVLAPGWTPDGKQIVFSASDGHGWRIYLQDLEGGKLRAVTPEIAPPSTEMTQLVSPDGRFVWAFDPQQRAWLYPLGGSAPVAIPGLHPDDVWASWGPDSRTAYVYHSEQYPLRIFRLDLISGERKLVKELMPDDPVGLDSVLSARVSRDAQSFAYSYQRSFSELYLVTGLK